MGGFVGIVNYSANYLYELGGLTGLLWGIAEKIEGGCTDSVDIVDDCCAFVMNSNRVIKAENYYKRNNGGVYYLLTDGWSDGKALIRLLLTGGPSFPANAGSSLSGAFFAVSEKKLILFSRGFESKPLYFWKDGEEFIFGSSIKAMAHYRPPGANQIEMVPPGGKVIYDAMGIAVLL